MGRRRKKKVQTEKESSPSASPEEERYAALLRDMLALILLKHQQDLMRARELSKIRSKSNVDREISVGQLRGKIKRHSSYTSAVGDEDIMAEGSSADPSSQYNSLFIFKEDNPLRRKCKAIVTWTPFEYAILIIIIINCVILGFGLYLPDDSETGQLLEKTEIYFLIVFLVEMVLKVIAYGFVLHPGSYLRNPWNIIDFFVIIVGIVSFFPLGIELSVLRMLRIVRLLRLFRLIKLLRSKN